MWFEPEGLLTSGGRLAFLFPGVEPEFAPNVADVATHFGLPDLPDLTGRPALEAQSLGIIAVGRLLADAPRASASPRTWRQGTAWGSGRVRSSPA